MRNEGLGCYVYNSPFLGADSSDEDFEIASSFLRKLAKDLDTCWILVGESMMTSSNFIAMSNQDRFKFRAFDLIDNKMKEVLELEFDNHGSFEAKVHGAATHCDNMFEYIGPKWVMQSSSRKDKNGNLIFEGDLLRTIENCLTGSGEKIGEVVFKDGMFTVRSSPLHIITQSFKPEIIGNVHQDSHLLNKIK